MERAEARRAELLGARCEVQIRVRRRVGRQALARSKEPVELVDLTWRQRGSERVSDGIAIERHRLPKSARDEEADRPFVDCLEEVGMAQEKQPELGGHLAGDQVEEHVWPAAICAARRS